MKLIISSASEYKGTKCYESGRLFYGVQIGIKGKYHIHGILFSGS